MNPRAPHDATQPPVNPQFQLGATASQGELATELVQKSLPPPGHIASRLGQQFELPQAEPSANLVRNFPNNLPTS